MTGIHKLVELRGIIEQILSWISQDYDVVRYVLIAEKPGDYRDIVHVRLVATEWQRQRAEVTPQQRRKRQHAAYTEYTATRVRIDATFISKDLLPVECERGNIASLYSAVSAMDVRSTNSHRLSLCVTNFACLIFA